MIDHLTIEKIKETARIEDVVGQYVTLHRRGANLTGLCPFHDEKTPSFNVNPSRNIFKCFGCGKAGNPISFVMEYEKCSYPDALRKVAAMYHIEVQETAQTDEEKKRAAERELLFGINTTAQNWYEEQLWNSQEGQAIGLSYLMNKRGLREDIIRTFHIGYSPARSSLPKVLTDKYPEENILKLRVCGKFVKTETNQDGEEVEKTRWYDNFSGRVVFPWFTVSGQTIAFNGRRLDGIKEKKYVNSSEVEGFFAKKDVLFGLFQAKNAIAKQNFCYIVEGQMDVISMYQAGVQNVVASSGTALTENQVRLISHYTKNVVVLYDGDAAGQKASNRGMDMFFKEGMKVKVLLLPQEEDPDSLAHKLTSDEFSAYLKEHQSDFIQYKIDQVKAKGDLSPDVIMDLIHDIARTIAVIPNAIDRQVYIQTTSAKMNLPEALLSKEVANNIAKIREDERKQQEREKRKEQNQANSEMQSKDGEEQMTESQSTLDKDSADTLVLPNVQLEQKLQGNERNLAMMMVRYGNKVVFTDENGVQTDVATYILKELDNDSISFTNADYQHILDEYRNHKEEENFDPEKYFTTCDDMNLLAIGCDLASQKYQLTNISESDQLSESVPKMILELKLSHIEIQLFEIKQKIKQQAGDELITLLRQQQELDQIRREICKIIR